MRRRAFLILTAFTAALPAAALAGEEKKKAGGESYLPVTTLTGATTKADGHRGVLSVDCGLDVPDPKLRQRADLSLPRLRAAYVQIVQAYATGLPPGVVPSAEFLSQALQRETNSVLGRPGARLLLGSILVN